MYAHLIGNDPGKRGLSKPGRAVEKDVIQGIVALLGSFYIDLQGVFGLFLTNVFVQGLRTEISLQGKILFHDVCCYNAIVHYLPLIFI